MANRTTFAGVEVRAEAGRVLSGVVMAYGSLSPGHRERFAPGALRPVGEPWLDLEHDRLAIVAYGSDLVLDNTPEALRMRATVPRTPAGDAALDGVRSGKRRGLSVEFMPIKETREAQTGIRLVEDAGLVGIGLVPEPSYASSQVELRQRAGPSVSARVPLGQPLACRCRTGCDTIVMEPSAFDASLAEVEAGDRIVTAFLSDQFATPLASVSPGGGLTVRRAGRELQVEIAGLPDSAAAREFLEASSTGTRYTARPYFRDDESVFEKIGTTAIFSQATLRGVELAPLTGPVTGHRPVEVRHGQSHARRVFQWL